MDQRRVKGFKAKLIEKKQQILEAYSKNQTYGKEANGEGAQDIADKASNSYAKEFLFNLSNSEREMLHLVDEALDRISSRHYGQCAACQGEVERKRLEAVPWAKHCISCQEEQEREQLSSR